MLGLIALMGRLLFWLGSFYIVAHAVISTFQAGDYVWTILVLIFAPLTYFIYPFYSGLINILIISLAGYVCSIYIGRIPPVEG